jgi:hypothetical protein
VELRLSAVLTRTRPTVSPAELDADHVAQTSGTAEGDLDSGIGLRDVEQLPVEEEEPLTEIDVRGGQPGLDDLGKTESTPTWHRFGEDLAHLAAVGHAASLKEQSLKQVLAQLYRRTVVSLTALHVPTATKLSPVRMATKEAAREEASVRTMSLGTFRTASQHRRRLARDGDNDQPHDNRRGDDSRNHD